MSDEEEQYEEEVEEEYEETAQEVEQKKTLEQHEEEQVTSPKEKMAPAVQQALEAKEDTKQHLRRAPPPKPREPDGHEITEAEQKMLDVKKRHEEEEEAKIRDNDERRRQELHQVEDELRQLRERQVQRKAEREQEEADLAAKRRQDEERRRKAEDERKARIEEEKWHRDEERRKRQLMLGGAALDVEGGRPQQVAKSKRKGLTPEEQAAAKRNYIAGIRPADVANMLPNDIKIKIKQLYARILKLEGDKYDLEKRKDRQEYDIKELGERQRQQARHKAIDSGVDPTEMENTNLPPKIRVASKFDRQTDRRDYGERRDLFESPVVKPAPSLVHGSGRPPANWGRKEFEELEQLRKNMEPPKYFEEVKAEGDAARPPVPVIPLQLPPDAEVEVPASGKKQQVNGGKQVNGTSAAAAEAEAAGWRERAAQKQKQMPAPPPKEKKVRV